MKHLDTWVPHKLKWDPVWYPIGRGNQGDLLPVLHGTPHKTGPLPGTQQDRAMALADPRSGTYFDFNTYERVEVAAIGDDLYELLRYSASIPRAATSQILAATTAAWWAFIKGEG